MILRKQFVILVAALLLAAQFSTLAHAADHPFHVHDDSCSIYLNLEQHDLSHTTAEFHIPVIIAGEARNRLSKRAVVKNLASHYFARAPPYLT